MRLFVILTLFLAPCPTLADGCYIPKKKSADLEALKNLSSPDQHAILIDRGFQQELILRVVVRGATDEFAWILPIPAIPAETPEALDGGDKLFAYLYSVTAPEWQEAQDIRGGRPGCSPGQASLSTGSGGEDGVDLLGVDVVGDLVISTLAADTGSALEDWLANNGYEMPPSLGDMVQPYIDNKWVFLAMKVVPEPAEDLRLQVLRIRWPGEHPVFPLYLTSINGDSTKTKVTLFVFAEGRTDVEGMKTKFADMVTMSGGTYHGNGMEYHDVYIAHDTVTSDILDTLDGYWLTRLERGFTPSQMADLYPEAVDSVPYREIRYYSSLGPTRRGLPAGMLAVALAFLAFFVVLRLMPTATERP
jgi:hypothetical protein